MNLRKLFPVIALCALAGNCSADTLNIVNADFSAVPVACGGGYAYQSSLAGADCGGQSVPQQDFNSNPLTGWTFTNSGLTGPSTNFNPPGFGGLFTQAAFLQGAGSSVSQSIGGFLDSETYALSFYLGSRYSDSPDGNQTVTVFIDGAAIDQYTLSSNTPFGLITTDMFSVASGDHTLTIEGSTDGDHTAFFSDVSLTGIPGPVPEPATSAMFAAGLFGVWRLARPKRRA